MIQDTTLHAYLAARPDVMRDEYVCRLCEHVPFCRAIPPEQLQSAVGAFIRVFLDETIPRGDITPMVTWLLESLRTYAPQGLVFEGAVALVTQFRRVVLSTLEPLLEARVEGVHRLLVLTEDFCEAAAAESARIHTDALESAQQELRESEARYRQLVELSPDGVVVYREGIFLYINPSGRRIFGTDDLIGKEVVSVIVAEQREFWREAILAAERTAQTRRPVEASVARPDGKPTTVEMAGAPILYEGLPARQVVVRDITERKRAEEALQHAAVQEETIRAQEAMLRELSTPLIPVSDGVVVMPLIGVIDRVRAEQLLRVLLDGVSAAAAKVAILDVTGVPTMDASVARALIAAVSAARLLGAEVVFTGVKPAAARVLVELGVSFGQVVTRATLKDGIAHALAQEKRR